MRTRRFERLGLALLLVIGCIVFGDRSLIKDAQAQQQSAPPPPPTPPTQSPAVNPSNPSYSRDLWPAEWAPTVILRGNNPVGRMSALPPKADMEASMTGETVSVVRANRRLLARIASVKVQNSFGIPVRVHDGK